MKRSHEPDEGKDLELEKLKWAKENDEARKQGKTYVEHGGKYDGSMKSSLFQHVMDVTEDMYKIPEGHGFIFFKFEKLYFLRLGNSLFPGLVF